MENKEWSLSYTEYTPQDPLPEEVLPLIKLAYETAKKAHAPYSDFRVGSVVELEDGSIITGNNQENIAYPSGLCAERVTLFSAKANYPDQDILRMVLTAIENGQPFDHPAFPCGACRQVMVEVESLQNRPFELWLVGRKSIIRMDSASSLLPLKFVWDGPHRPA